MKISDRNGVPGARVDGTPLTIGTAQGTAPRTPPPAKTGSQGETATLGDRVEVSDVAKTLARLATYRQAVTEGIDTVREDRVAALREAVARGQYRPDAEAVARSVLAETFGSLIG